jgi:hypothetical protein
MSYPAAIALMEKGRANPSNYRVILPSQVVQYAPSAFEMNEYISFFTRAATLPSPSNAVMQLKGQEKVGIARNVITSRNYGSPAVFTFTERSDLLIYSTLKSWIDSSVINSGQTGLNQNLRVQYYDSIKCLIQVDKLEPQLGISGANHRGHRVTGRWQLHNAIPIAIEQSTLAIESADSALDFTLSVAFEHFTYEKVNTQPMELAQ